MITELYIENYKADITSDVDAMLSFAIDDVKDFGSRNTNYSKTLILPGTANNNKIFGNIFSVNQYSISDGTKPNVNYNFNSSVVANCILFQGNIQVFKGVIRVLEIDIDNDRIEYQCALFGELGNLIAKLAALKLEDLDFKAYNHTYNISNIVSSWSNSGSGVFYPLIDYGAATTPIQSGSTDSSGAYSGVKHDWQVGTFKPALFVKEYIDKIFAAAGFTYSSSLFNTTRFKNLIVPHNTKTLVKTTTQALSASIANTKTILSGTTYSKNIPFDITTLGNFTANGDSSVFTYTGTTTNFTFTWQVYGIISGGNYDYVMSFYKNGTILSTITQPFSSSDRPYSWFYSNNVTLTTGDTISIQFSTSTSNSGFTVGVDIAELRMDTAVAQIAPVNYGDSYTINNSIPKNVLQKDFISSIIKLFNLYVYEDAYTSNKLNIAPYVDFYALSTTNVLDWTYKMDRSKPINIKPMSELTSRYYLFNYKDDSDYYNDQYKKRYNISYGSYLLDTEYQFAEDKTSVDLIFSGTPLIGYSGQDKIYPTIFKRSGTVEETIDSNIRIMQIKNVTGVSSWKIYNGATVLGTYTNYPYAGHFDNPDAPANDLNFAMPNELYFPITNGAFNVNQFNLYWLDYMYEITDQNSRLMTATFRLNESDINNLDFSKFIYIEGALFRLNKIVDYNASSRDVCKVELLRAIDVEFNSSSITSTLLVDATNHLLINTTDKILY
jgi:hypothetical protein